MAKCPSEWLLEISADAPLHKTINWCQCERVTQTMPGKREKGQRQVTKMLKVLKESTIEEAITSLMKKMPHYLQHVFVQRKQTRFFQEKFKTLMRKRQLFRLILQRITLAFKQPSPASANPKLGASLIKYLRKEIGQEDILPKRPLFDQDFQHILDCQGLETPAALQSKSHSFPKKIIQCIQK